MAVYKRGKKGIWYMSFTINGVKVFRSTKTTSKKEAKHIEAQERHKLLNESKLSPQEKGARTLLLDAIEQVYENRWKSTKDAKRTYGRAQNLAAIVGNMPLNEITEECVDGLISHLVNREAEPGTINRYLASLKTILKHKKQPSDHIKLRKEPLGRIRVVSREEETQIQELLRNAPNGKNRLIYPDIADLLIVLIDTGLRVSEALDSTYRHNISLNSNLLTVWKSKNDKARSVPLTSRAKEILEHRHVKNPDRPFPYKLWQVENVWKWIRGRMLLEDDKEFVPHSLRHTCASRLVNAGVDLYVVKEWLGHSSIKVTERYAHLSPVKLVQAVKALED